MLIAIIKGMTDQSVSNLCEPATGRGISNGLRRRYLMTKKISTLEIRTVKKSASTRPEIVDALSGTNGIHEVCIILRRFEPVVQSSTFRLLLARTRKLK